MNRLLACCIAALLLCPCPALAGSYRKTAIAEDMGWSPDGCKRPTLPPLPEIDDLESYNTAVTMYNAYLEMVNRYVECATQEAKQDAKAVIEAINRGLSDEVRAVRKDLKSFERHVESGHPDNKPL